jgi:hypothetical protein
MKLLRIGGAVALLAVTAAIVGVLANFLVRNDLLTASEWQVPALLSLGVVLGALLVFASIGTPWSRWKRTPYW